ncbi:MAG: SEC-C domain-containing protein [Clostridia bacterium]|nr:SEC-C domain-containing protein [Clostridia bacterium]
MIQIIFYNTNSTKFSPTCGSGLKYKKCCGKDA